MRRMFRSVISSLFFVSLLLSAAPAYGFLGSLDSLKEEFETMESAPESQINTILLQLEKMSGNTFRDVQSDDWFYKYVSSVARWGIASGYKNEQGERTGYFGPGDSVTVVQIIKMALRAAQVDETQCGQAQLAQARGHWANSFIACAEQISMRIIHPQLDINREALRAEVLSIVHDAFGDTIPPMLSTFKDTVDHSLESDIAYAAALGIVSGDEDKAGNPTGTFRPNDGVNRAEAAKIIYEKLRVEVMGEG